MCDKRMLVLLLFLILIGILAKLPQRFVHMNYVSRQLLWFDDVLIVDEIPLTTETPVSVEGR